MSVNRTNIGPIGQVSQSSWYIPPSLNPNERIHVFAEGWVQGKTSPTWVPNFESDWSPVQATGFYGMNSDFGRLNFEPIGDMGYQSPIEDPFANGYGNYYTDQPPPGFFPQNPFPDFGLNPGFPGPVPPAPAPAPVQAPPPRPLPPQYYPVPVPVPQPIYIEKPVYFPGGSRPSFDMSGLMEMFFLKSLFGGSSTGGGGGMGNNYGRVGNLVNNITQHITNNYFLGGNGGFWSPLVLPGTCNPPIPTGVCPPPMPTGLCAPKPQPAPSPGVCLPPQPPAPPLPPADACADDPLQGAGVTWEVTSNNTLSVGWLTGKPLQFDPRLQGPINLLSYKDFQLNATQGTVAGQANKVITKLDLIDKGIVIHGDAAQNRYSIEDNGQIITLGANETRTLSSGHTVTIQNGNLIFQDEEQRLVFEDQGDFFKVSSQLTGGIKGKVSGVVGHALLKGQAPDQNALRAMVMEAGAKAVNWQTYVNGCNGAVDGFAIVSNNGETTGTDVCQNQSAHSENLELSFDGATSAARVGWFSEPTTLGNTMTGAINLFASKDFQVNAFQQNAANTTNTVSTQGAFLDDDDEVYIDAVNNTVTVRINNNGTITQKVLTAADLDANGNYRLDEDSVIRVTGLGGNAKVTLTNEKGVYTWEDKGNTVNFTGKVGAQGFRGDATGFLGQIMKTRALPTGTELNSIRLASISTKDNVFATGCDNWVDFQNWISSNVPFTYAEISSTGDPHFTYHDGAYAEDYSVGPAVFYAMTDRLDGSVGIRTVVDNRETATWGTSTVTKAMGAVLDLGKDAAGNQISKRIVWERYEDPAHFVHTPAAARNGNDTVPHIEENGQFVPMQVSREYKYTATNDDGDTVTYTVVYDGSQLKISGAGAEQIFQGNSDFMDIHMTVTDASKAVRSTGYAGYTYRWANPGARATYEDAINQHFGDKRRSDFSTNGLLATYQNWRNDLLSFADYARILKNGLMQVTVGTTGT